MKFLIHKFYSYQQFRFLFFGGINTIFGYLFSTFIYYLLENLIHTSIILIFANIVAVTFSFTTNRLFVFQSKLNILHEYLKFWSVNLLGIIIRILVITILVDYMFYEFWIVNAIITLVFVFYFYFSHKHFTFKGSQ